MPAAPAKAIPRLLLCFALALAHLTARAADSTTARAIFDTAAQAYHEQRYQDAIGLFRRAYEIDPRPELVYNIAQAYEKLADAPDALRAFREYLRLAPGANERATIEIEIETLERRLAERGVQQVTIRSNPPGARLLLDGKDVGDTPWTGELTPGRHHALLQAARRQDTARDFMLTLDRAVDVDVALLGPTPAPPIAAPPQREVPEGETPRPRQVRALTWTAFGVGAAALVGSLAFELSRRSAETDAEAAKTQIAYQHDYENMTQRQTAARVLLGVGGVAVAAGGVLLYFDLGRPRRNTAVSIGAGCDAALCGVRARGRF